MSEIKYDQETQRRLDEIRETQGLGAMWESPEYAAFLEAVRISFGVLFEVADKLRQLESLSKTEPTPARDEEVRRVVAEARFGIDTGKEILLIEDNGAHTEKTH